MFIDIENVLKVIAELYDKMVTERSWIHLLGHTKSTAVYIKISSEKNSKW